MKVTIDAWGPRNHWVFTENILNGYAIVRDDESKLDAVIRSIERRTRLVFCSQVRLDCITGDDYHYVGTLGRPCEHSGFTPEVQVYFSI